jgi:hypothetical protein
MRAIVLVHRPPGLCNAAHSGVFAGSFPELQSWIPCVGDRHGGAGVCNPNARTSQSTDKGTHTYKRWAPRAVTGKNDGLGGRRSRSRAHCTVFTLGFDAVRATLPRGTV